MVIVITEFYSFIFFTSFFFILFFFFFLVLCRPLFKATPVVNSRDKTERYFSVSSHVIKLTCPIRPSDRPVVRRSLFPPPLSPPPSLSLPLSLSPSLPPPLQPASSLSLTPLSGLSLSSQQALSLSFFPTSPFSLSLSFIASCIYIL